MDYINEINQIELQITKLVNTKKTLEFKQNQLINNNQYMKILARLQKWCKIMIEDHHVFYILDKKGSGNYYYGRNNISKNDLGVIITYDNFTYRMGGVFDEVYNDGNFKIYVVNEKLKIKQRKKIDESIKHMIETDELLYYEF